MKPLNKTDDVEKYKNFGILTQPFLDKNYIYDKVITDLEHNQKDLKSGYFLASLFMWIKKEVKYSHEEQIQNLKFTRTAKEIWESKKQVVALIMQFYMQLLQERLEFPPQFCTQQNMTGCKD